MRIAVLFLAVLLIGVGAVGLTAPDTLTEVRRTYVAMPHGLHAMAAVRVVFGFLLILSASASRTPKTLRTLGALIALATGSFVAFGVR